LFELFGLLFDRGDEAIDVVGVLGVVADSDSDLSPGTPIRSATAPISFSPSSGALRAAATTSQTSGPPTTTPRRSAGPSRKKIPGVAVGAHSLLDVALGKTHDRLAALRASLA